MVKKSGVVFLAIMIGISLVGLAKMSSAEDPKPAVIIGGVTPLTGPCGLAGVAIREGMDYAAEVYNAKGGILGGRKILIKWLDDKSIPSEGVSAVRRHLANGIRIFCGTYNSSVGLAEFPVFKHAGAISVAGGVTHPKGTGEGIVFSPRPVISVSHIEHIKRLVATFHPESVYLVCENTDYGRNVSKFAKATFKELGVQIKGVAYPEHSEVEWRTLLTKIREINPSLFCVSHSGVAPWVELLKQSAEVGIRDKFQPLFGSIGDQLKAAPAELTEGIWSTSIWIPAIDNPINKKFVAEWKKKTGNIPTDNLAMAYQIMAVLIDAIDRAASDNDIKAISREMLATDMPGLWGRCRIEPKSCRIVYEPQPYVIHNNQYYPQK